jgi:hypothetical protein
MGRLAEPGRTASPASRWWVLGLGRGRNPGSYPRQPIGEARSNAEILKGCAMDEEQVKRVLMAVFVVVALALLGLAYWLRESILALVR